MAQKSDYMDTWEVPITGTATANDTVNETVSILDDILRNRNLVGKPVEFKKMIMQATAELEGNLIIAGQLKAYHCLSPNFTDVIVFDKPKKFMDDLVIQITETNGATPDYVIHTSGLRSMM